MKKLLVIAGQCATGKSTFAKRLGEAVGQPYYCKDILKERLADSLQSRDGQVVSRLSAATFSMMACIAEASLKGGQPVILEGNFRPAEADRLAALLREQVGECLTFLFWGDDAALFERYRRRDSQRHWVHTRIQTQESFVALNSSLTAVALGRVIEVDATDFREIDYERLLGVAAEFLQG